MADAQFPSRFEVKMNKREENSIYSVVSLGSRRKGGVDKKACLAHTALEDESAVTGCRAPLKRVPFGRSGWGGGIRGDSFPRVSHNTDPIFFSPNKPRSVAVAENLPDFSLRVVTILFPSGEPALCSIIFPRTVLHHIQANECLKIIFGGRILSSSPGQEA